MVNEFQKATGITVAMTRKSSGETYAQVKAEAANPKGDIWWGGTGDPHLQAAEEDLTVAYDSPMLAELNDWAVSQHKTGNGKTVVAEFDWDDVGLWTALPRHIPPDPSGNTIRGQAATVGSTNNIVVSNGRMVALCGVKDLVVVEMSDAVLVCHRDAVQNIKQLVGQLPKELL